ncbi:hypothetical protein [Sporolituus thermophilus]|uniref:Uncharacterized protein n=1 Tax=Sporolituus thermophilus DSM 23256 TaxID=1123285 RepID=A0A1G7J4K6_9FIRM|nr:hypothetical protein [Sporolituus thermophilus]SDF19459.1 hypothetical protein SAMN05660235_00741 [Sporolituus thermophilus DSM 23256]
MADKQKLQTSKSKYGTLTATQDVNADYSSSNASPTNTKATGKQKASKSEYGTLTAKADANNDYE